MLRWILEVNGRKRSTLSLKTSKEKTDREQFSCEATQYTCVETGLVLSDKAGNETTVDSRSPHLALLGSFPSVGVREDELDVVLDGFPDGGAAGMCFDDERPSATEEILEEIAEDFESGFRMWQIRELHTVHPQFHGFRTERELEAGAYIVVR